MDVPADFVEKAVAIDTDLYATSRRMTESLPRSLDQSEHLHEFFAACDDLPCGPPQPETIPVGPTTGLQPEVELKCVHSQLMGLSSRRMPARRDVSPEDEQSFGELARAVLRPLRAALDDDDLLRGDPHDLFEWWVTRPQITPAARARLRAVEADLYAYGKLQGDECETKSFTKLEVLLKRIFKSRIITCMADVWNILVAPAVQRVAYVVGLLLKPGVYATLPGALPLDLVWLKGFTCESLGRFLMESNDRFPYSLGTDGVMWDGSHTVAQLANVNLYRRFLPPWVARLHADHKFVTRIKVALGDSRRDTDYAVFRTSVDGSILTGEPNVSLDNTLICLVLHLWTYLYHGGPDAELSALISQC